MLSVQQLLDQKPKGIYSVGPDDPVLTAIKKMAEHHIGALLVMTGDKLVGIISERDYARKVVLLGRSSDRDAGRGHHDLQGDHRHRRSRTRTIACAS